MKKEATITVRIPEQLKQEFQRILDVDPRQLTQSQIIRHWIDQYVATHGNEDVELRLKNAMLASRLRELEYQIKILRGDFEREEKLDLERDFYKKVEKAENSIKNKEKND